MTRIFNTDCMELMQTITDGEIDIILTSPPYNTNRKTGKQETGDSKSFPYVRYDMPMDNMNNEEYTRWVEKIFTEFGRILRADGVILWNANYGANNTEALFLSLAAVLQNTPFTIADVICWKKPHAVPNNMSQNRLTRIWEPVFVIVRKEEAGTFYCSKKVVSLRSTGQKNYENVRNFIEAKNNDGVCKLNRSTYSSELCEQLLSLYGHGGMLVYDPFMGTGTTGAAAQRLDMSFIGSEISPAQCEYAAQRLDAIVETGAF